MRESFVEALKCKYEAEISAAKATALVYFDKPVAIGEHPQFLDELDKLVEKIAAAEEKLEVLIKHFDKQIPF